MCNVTFYNLTEEQRASLKLTYLDGVAEHYKVGLLSLGLTVRVLTTLLYHSTISHTISLTREQLEDLARDIRYCEENGLWNKAEESYTIEQCRESLEQKEMYLRMNERDKQAFDILRSKAVNKFLQRELQRGYDQDV